MIRVWIEGEIMIEFGGEMMVIMTIPTATRAVLGETSQRMVVVMIVRVQAMTLHRTIEEEGTDTFVVKKERDLMRAGNEGIMMMRLGGGGGVRTDIKETEKTGMVVEWMWKNGVPETESTYHEERKGMEKTLMIDLIGVIGDLITVVMVVDMRGTDAEIPDVVTTMKKEKKQVTVAQHLHLLPRTW
jgi:hypothetical protein